MSINQRQFEILTEMGIPLWRRRTLTLSNHNNNDNSDIKVDTTQLNPPAHNISVLTQQQFFKDILLSLNLPLTAVKMKNYSLDLGLFTWKFIEGNSIALHQNCLTTPKLTSINQSPQFKRLLWHTIQYIKS